MLIVEILVIVGFLCYCFTYVCVKETSSTLRVLTLLAPMLIGFVCLSFIPKEPFWMIPVAHFVWIIAFILWPIFLMVAEKKYLESGRSDTKKESKQRQYEQMIFRFFKDNNKPYSHEIIKMLFENDSPLYGRLTRYSMYLPDGKVSMHEMEMWLRDKYTEKLSKLTDEELVQIVGRDFRIHAYYDLDRLRRVVIICLVQREGFPFYKSDREEFLKLTPFATKEFVTDYLGLPYPIK